MADLLSLTSCVRTYEWLLICHWANDAISPLLREGGLRNDAARAALWRTRPYECAIDVCQLLTMVIADVCRELSFYLYWFATNGGFVWFNKLWYVLALANFYKWCAYQNWHERCPIAIARYGLVENQQLVIARDYRERVFIFTDLLQVADLFSLLFVP